MPSDFISAGMLQLVRLWPARIGCVCAFFISLVAVAPAADNPGQIIVLKAARLFDGKSKALITNGVVIVQGTTITDAGATCRFPLAPR